MKLPFACKGSLSLTLLYNTAQTHNPLTGEVYAGHERQVQAEEMSRPGRKKGACNSIGSFEEGVQFVYVYILNLFRSL